MTGDFRAVVEGARSALTEAPERALTGLEAVSRQVGGLVSGVRTRSWRRAD